MTVTPDQLVDSVRDRIVKSDNVDLSADHVRCIFMDPEDDYRLVGVWFIPSVNYVSSQAVTFDVGIVGDLDKFIDGATLGTAALAVGVPSSVFVPNLSPAKSRLLAGEALMLDIIHNGSQTGEGHFHFRLRPYRRTYGNRTRFPSSATSQE
jgi:hypothetical protein